MSSQVTVYPIRNDEDFQRAQDRLAEIFNAPEGSQEADERDVLWALSEAYDKQFALPEVTPREVVQRVMRDKGLSVGDLSIYFGAQARVSEFLAGKIELNVEQIRRLHEGLEIPLALLIGKSEELWTIPANRRQHVFRILSRSLEGSVFRLETVEAFTERAKKIAWELSVFSNMADRKAVATATYIYLPPDQPDRRFAVVVEDGVPKIRAYGREPEDGEAFMA